MTSPAQRNRARRLQAVTLALTVVLAVALVGIVYFAVTSLPYLASSPSTDAVFGTANACLLAAVPERVGFAVSPDTKRVAAWSTSQLVECVDGVPTAFPLSGITLGTYDGSNTLWIADSTHLERREGERFVERGTFSPTAMVGTARGVLAIDPQGQLIALAADGSISASRQLTFPLRVTMSVNVTGSLVSLFSGGRFTVVNAVTLESTPAEAPCPVRWVWWRPEEVLLLAECVDMAIELNALDSRSALMQARAREHSTLSGPSGVYFEACDNLPCSVEAPR